MSLKSGSSIGLNSETLIDYCFDIIIGRSGNAIFWSFKVLFMVPCRVSAGFWFCIRSRRCSTFSSIFFLLRVLCCFCTDWIYSLETLTRLTKGETSLDRSSLACKDLSILSFLINLVTFWAGSSAASGYFARSFCLHAVKKGWN